MYGAALETWKQEPLTSSGLDVWVKRTPRLIINDWYMVDDYHRDTGEGADLYSVGRTRGCGGSGLLGRRQAVFSRELPELPCAGQWPAPGDVRVDVRAVRGRRLEGHRDEAHHAGRRAPLEPGGDRLTRAPRRTPFSPQGSARIPVRWSRPPATPESCGPGSRSSRRDTSGVPSSFPRSRTPAKRTAITWRSPHRSRGRACTSPARPGIAVATSSRLKNGTPT